MARVSVRSLLPQSKEQVFADSAPIASYDYTPNSVTSVRFVSTRTLLIEYNIKTGRSAPMASPVMETPSQRAALKKAERSSGLSNPEEEAEIDIAYLKTVTCGMCSGCGIYVGPDHKEKSYYFSFVRNTFVYYSDDTRGWIGDKGYLAFYCEGCALKHGLPGEYRLLDRGHCETNYLLVESLSAQGQTLRPRILRERSEKQQIAILAREYMLEKFRLYTMMLAVLCGIKIFRVFCSYADRPLEEARLQAKNQKKLEAKRRKHTPKKQQEDRSLLEQIARPSFSDICLPTPQPQHSLVINMQAVDLFDQRCLF